MLLLNFCAVPSQKGLLLILSALAAFMLALRHVAHMAADRVGAQVVCQRVFATAMIIACPGYYMLIAYGAPTELRVGASGEGRILWLTQIFFCMLCLFGVMTMT